MSQPKPSAAGWLKPPSTLTSFVISGSLLVAACSSSESTPNGAGGTGAVPTTTAGASGSAATGGGGASAAGSAGTVSTSGAGTGGSAAGGGAGGAGGTTGGSSGSGGAPTAGAAGSSGGTPLGGSGGVSGGGASGAGGGGGASCGGSSTVFELTSCAFKEGEEVPLKYKCANVPPAGQNMSPPLSWGPGPAGTKSYAIVLNHVPTPEHWVIWDIPANVTSLPENIEHAAQPAMPAGTKQSLVNLDGFQGSGYLGPCPQAPNSRQSYTFTLYALDVDTVPGLSGTSTPAQAAAAVKMHLVAGSKGVTLTGTQIQTP